MSSSGAKRPREHDDVSELPRKRAITGAAANLPRHFHCPEAIWPHLMFYSLVPVSRPRSLDLRVSARLRRRAVLVLRNVQSREPTGARRGPRVRLGRGALPPALLSPAPRFLWRRTPPRRRRRRERCAGRTRDKNLRRDCPRVPGHRNGLSLHRTSAREELPESGSYLPAALLQYLRGSAGTSSRIPQAQSPTNVWGSRSCDGIEVG